MVPATSAPRGSRKPLIFPFVQCFSCKDRSEGFRATCMAQPNPEALVGSTLTSVLGLGSREETDGAAAFLGTRGPATSPASAGFTAHPPDTPTSQVLRILLFPGASKLPPPWPQSSRLRRNPLWLARRGRPVGARPGGRGWRGCLRDTPGRPDKRGLYLNLTFFVSPLHMNIYREESKASPAAPHSGNPSAAPLSDLTRGR